MKKNRGIFLVLAAFIFVACSGKAPHEALTNNLVVILSGDMFSRVSMHSHELYVYSEDYERVEAIYHNLSIGFRFAKDATGTYLCCGALDPLAEVRTEWAQKHCGDFESINFDAYFKSDYFYKNPLAGNIKFAFLRIKSVKLYSPDKVLAGRPAGADLSDLFNIIFHPMLFSYPDCTFSYPAYCEPGGEVLTLSDIVKYKLVPTANMWLVPMFDISSSKLNSTHFCLEMIVEDDVCGERTFTADTQE